jgi:biopolymer transport protein ExbD
MWLPSQKVARRAAKRTSGYYTGIDGSLFRCIPLTLMVFLFMGSPHHGVSMNIPIEEHATSQPGAARDDAMRVTVLRDAHVFFRRNYVRCDELPILIRRAVEQGAERKIYLAADARTKYADVEVVIDQIRSSGINRVVVMSNIPAASM